MPPTNSSVSQLVQIGYEGATPGVAVPADKLLQAMSIAPRMQGESNEFTPQGQKYATLVVPNKLWTTAPITGQPTYTELQYPLAGILAWAVAPSGSGSEWTFTTATGGPDDVATYTVEYGSDLIARRFTNGLVRTLGLNWARNQGISMSGEFFGRAMESGITLTATPTALPLIPIVAKDVNVYLDDTAAGIGTTQLLNPFMFSFEIGTKFNPKYVLDRAQGLTFQTHVEVRPTITAKLRHEADAQGMALLDNFNEGSKFYIRVEAISDLEVAPGEPYSLILDGAFAVRSPEPFADEDGTYAVEWTLTALNDDDLGGPFSLTLFNDQAAL